MPVHSLRVSKIVLWRKYFVALFILVATVTASHILSDWIVRQQEQYAAIINVSGKQRMLSQRITGLIAKASIEARAQLRPRPDEFARVNEAIAEMQAAHDALTGRNGGEDAPGMTSGIKGIYFGGVAMLNDRVETFLAEARRLEALAADGQPMDPDEVEAFSNDGFGSLLATLDLAVGQYQRDAESKLEDLRQLNIGLWFVTMLVIILELVFIFRPLTRRIDKAQDELEAIARTDPLTGCWNRRALIHAGETMWSLARRQGRPLSVIISDIDKFKRINDEYGYAVGDEAIKFFAQTCLDGLRQYDVLGRFGGEEFVLVLPDTDELGAAQVAERIRANLESKTVVADGHSFQMTASFGVAALRHEDDLLHAIIDRADQALYAAKENGRNRVEFWREELAEVQA